MDTTALIVSNYVFSCKKAVTSRSVLNEVKDAKSRIMVEVAISQGRLEIAVPKEEFIEKVRKIAEKTNDYGRLSVADLELLAVALDLKEQGVKAKIFTDDYSVMNVAEALSIDYQPIRTRGISKHVRWIKYCPVCGRTFKGKINSCPDCGVKLRYKALNRR